MTIFRWIIGGLFALLALGALASFGLYVALDGELWLVRARRVRRWLWLLTLFWFNTEIWGQVVYTLFHWK